MNNEKLVQKGRIEFQLLCVLQLLIQNYIYNYTRRTNKNAIKAILNITVDP
jgi:hypothetical protein